MRQKKICQIFYLTDFENNDRLKSFDPDPKNQSASYIYKRG